MGAMMAALMLLTVVQGTAQGVSEFVYTHEELEGTLHATVAKSTTVSPINRT